MAPHPIRAVRRWVERLSRTMVFAIGVFTGGIMGVIFSVLAFSAFLFQFLSSLKDAIVALATVVLAIATISLYQATSVLARSTKTLAEIESKRDRRENLTRRIQLGEKVANENPEFIIDYLRSPLTELHSVSWIKDLRQLIAYGEGATDDEIVQLLRLMDVLTTRLDSAINRKQAITKLDDEETIRDEIRLIQRNLRILIEKWRGQLPFLYE